jgi:hypothetical protein
MEQQKRDFTGTEVEIENQIYNSLIDIIGDSGFKIDKIKYYKEHFGNIIVRLNTITTFKVLFELDRGYLNCDIESLSSPTLRAGLREVLEFIGHEPIPKFVNFIDMLTSSLTVIKQNWPAITEAFDEYHVSITMNKIKSMSLIRKNELYHV